MMEAVYTHSQIQEAWENYRKAHCWRYMKPGGKKMIRMTAPDIEKEKDVLNCTMVPLKQAMSFPKYLEIEYGGR